MRNIYACIEDGERLQAMETQITGKGEVSKKIRSQRLCFPDVSSSFPSKEQKRPSKEEAKRVAKDKKIEAKTNPKDEKKRKESMDFGLI